MENVIFYCKYILKGIWSTLKHLFDPSGIVAKALIALVMFFSSIHSYFIAVLSLVVIDVFTGLIASYKTGVPFSSRKLRKGLIEKLCLYLILLITVFFLDKLMVADLGFARFYFSFVITFLICIYEISSVFENLHKIRPDIPFIAGLLGIFKGLGDKALKSLKKRSDDLIDKVTQLEIVPSEEVVPELPPFSGTTND